MVNASGAASEHRAETKIWWTLKVVFGLVPIVAGLDKFTNLLTVWEHYLAPSVVRLLPMSATSFMHMAGVIEIVAGLGVLLSPWTRAFAWIVALWLIGIAIELVWAGYYDVAVRDTVMAISAFCLAHLTAALPAEVRVRHPVMRPAEAR